MRGMARTAVIAGTATHVSNNVSRRQARRWGEQDAAQQAEQPAAPAQDDTYAQLEKLGQLKEQGILTQEEFDAKKKQILGL
jgi:membrane protease subunit (stomatin/prohibitin family)